MALTLELGYPRTSYSHGPTERQTIAHRYAAWVDEVLYGGATGGGKTDWLIAEVLAALFRWPGVTGGIFRRSYTELSQAEGIIPRLLTRIPRSVGSYNGTHHVWTFKPVAPGFGVNVAGAYTSKGSELHLGHVARDAELANYLGSEYAIQAWDQVEAHTEWQFITMQSRLRIPLELERAGLHPRAIATANPGGRGHVWVKRRWIDPAPPMVVWQPNPTDAEPAPGTRLFVPALLDDNPHVGPSYARRLDNLDPMLRRAWRFGDWDVLGGQRFGHFRRNTHVISPAQLPIPLTGGVPKAVGVDYGITAPFCALWGALFPGNPPLIVVYRELYKTDLTPRQQAELILASERPGERDPERPIPVFLDPSTWARAADVVEGKDNLHPERPPTNSIAWRYADAGVPVRRANNDRLAGAAALDEALLIHEYAGGIQLPGILIYDTCLNLIRTLPELMRGEKRPEDIEDDSEDHAYDALRYLLGGLGRFAHRRGITAGLGRQGF
jgi:hypothetical protein